MEVRQEVVNDFVKLFHRESLLMADNLGLDLTQDEIHQIKEQIVYLWVLQKLTDPYMQKLFDRVLSQPGFGWYLEPDEEDGDG